MLFEDHARLKAKAAEAWRLVESLRDERDELFQMTQGGGEGEPVISSPKNDRFDNYLIAKEKIQLDERIEEAEAIWRDWDTMTKTAEETVRASRALYDRVYVKIFIEHRSVRHTARIMGYSERNLFRIVNKIGSKCQLSRGKM